MNDAIYTISTKTNPKFAEKVFLGIIECGWENNSYTLNNFADKYPERVEEHLEENERYIQRCISKVRGFHGV